MATRAQIRTHIRNLRRLMRLERTMARKVTKELRARTLKAEAGFKKMGMGGAVLALEGHEKTMLEIIREQYLEAGEVFGKGLIDDLKGVGAFEYKDFKQTQFEFDLENYINSHSTAEIANDIANQTKIRIRNVIHRGIQEGLSTDQIAKSIHKLATVKISTLRSHVIARTETHNAAGFAQDSAARSSGVADLQKTWLTAMDTRVREAHEEQDEVTVDINALFGFSGEQSDYELMYPGDRRGPPEGIIMCRCFLNYDKPE